MYQNNNNYQNRQLTQPVDEQQAIAIVGQHELELANGETKTIDYPTVKNFLVPTNGEFVTPQEVALFIEVCKTMRLNPFVNDVYAVKYKPNQPLAHIVSKQAYIKIANRNQNYGGFTAGVIAGDKSSSELVYHKGSFYNAKKEDLLGGWCEVYDKTGNVIYEHSVAIGEYDKGYSEWKSKPATMIRKVALVQALRECFPSEYNTLYSEDEMPPVHEPAPVETSIETDAVFVSVDASESENSKLPELPKKPPVAYEPHAEKQSGEKVQDTKPKTKAKKSSNGKTKENAPPNMQQKNATNNTPAEQRNAEPTSFDLQEKYSSRAHEIELALSDVHGFSEEQMKAFFQRAGCPFDTVSAHWDEQLVSQLESLYEKIEDRVNKSWPWEDKLIEYAQEIGHIEFTQLLNDCGFPANPLHVKAQGHARRMQLLVDYFEHSDVANNYSGPQYTKKAREYITANV